MSTDQFERGVAALTDVVNRVYEWGNAAIKLNASKSNALICENKDFVDRIQHDLPCIEMSDIPISYVDQVETLEILIDSKLK